MRTILSPIDFSDNSTNALAFAAELAARASAHLVILHTAKKGETDSNAEKKLEDAESGIKKIYGNKVNCETSLLHGELIPAVKKAVAAHEPDLIVMGTKGASGLKRILIGSNTVNVIAGMKIPVLVIPEMARFENFLHKGKNKVVLATDLDLLKNEKTLNILKEIAMMIVEPKVRVVSVRRKDAHLPLMKKMVRDHLLSFFNPEIESERITVFSSNVIDGLNFYLSKNKNTGLVAMVARDSGYLIQKHYTREMASHTNLPLLVLYDV